MGIPDGTAGTNSNDGGPGLRQDGSVDSFDKQLGPNAAPTVTGTRYGRKRVQPPTILPLSASLIRDRYWNGFRALRPETYDYWLNHSYLLGQQWLWFNPETHRLDQLPRDPDRVQATVNRMWPASRTIISKLVSRELVFEVHPTQADDATVRAAKLGEAILSQVHELHSWEALREDACWATWKGGSCAIAVEWDPGAGEELGYDPETGRTIAIGDTVESVHTIAEFVVEPGSRIAETARWWIRANAFPPEQVQAKYHLSKKPAADASAGLTPLQNKLLSDARRGGFEHTPLTLVLTYFERPNFLRPEGAVATVVGDEIVDGPYKWYFPWTDHLNFALMRETPINGRWSGETVLTMARPIQTALNASWSSLIEHMKLAGNARLAMPQSAADLIDTMTDLPGEVFLYPDGTERPGYITPPQMPAWWVEQPKLLADEMDDIMGVHEVSRGDAPSNIESGYGLTILAEQDATPLGRLTKEQALAWSKVGTMILKLYEKFSKEPREAKIVVPGMPTESVQWTKKELMGQTHASVPLDAVIPRSRAAVEQFAEKAMQMGLIKSVEQFAQVAELGNQRQLLEVASPDVARARRENFQMAAGEIALPEPWDDHQAHVTEHNNFRKSVRFEMLSQKQKDVFEKHIQGHATMSAEELGEQFNKGQHNPLLAAAVSAKGAPSIMPQEGGALASQSAQGPGALPQLPAPQGPPTPGFPQGVPLPPPGEK